MEVKSTKSFDKSLSQCCKKYKKGDLKSIVNGFITKIENDCPFKDMGDVKTLSSKTPNQRRIRIGDFRLIFHIKDKTCYFTSVAKRGKDYKNI